MADQQDRSVALLAIQPRFVDAIASGKKRVEFRRRRFGRPISHVVIYATDPVKQVIGYFSVAHMTHESARRLWTRFERVSGLSRTEFMAYLKGATKPVAIGIRELRLLAEPVLLSELSRSLTAPQSYRYLSEKIFLGLVDLTHKEKNSVAQSK